jgi:AbrB family looped-hinge helix DNA binding protein
MSTTHTHPHKPAFYGTATIGTKGQIVIPAEAREELGLRPGDKVVVIGIKEHGMLGICPVSSVEKMLAQTTEQLEYIQKVMQQTKEVKES